MRRKEGIGTMSHSIKSTLIALAASAAITVAATGQPAGASGAGPTGYTYATAEGQPVAVNGPTDVAFGADGLFLFKYGVTSEIDCTIAAFGGDPDPYVPKSCFTLADVAPAGSKYSVPEGQALTFKGVADIAYGANGAFDFKYGVTNGVDCTNAAFGGDPDPDVHKSCYKLPDVGPAGFTYAVTEGAHLTLHHSSTVAFGARGQFKIKRGVTGGIDCTVAAFGRDPIPNVHKSCYTK
jgi:hypothetical protein